MGSVCNNSQCGWSIQQFYNNSTYYTTFYQPHHLTIRIKIYNCLEKWKTRVLIRLGQDILICLKEIHLSHTCDLIYFIHWTFTNTIHSNFFYLSKNNTKGTQFKNALKKSNKKGLRYYCREMYSFIWKHIKRFLESKNV